MPYSSREVIPALQGMGFEVVSQRGSHVKLRKVTSVRVHPVIVASPVREVTKGALGEILRQAGITRQELEAAM